jgi:NADH dehydrogenase
MHKVAIIGAGFAGLSALSRLRREKSRLEIKVFDKKDSFDFLPLLPDSVGRGIDPGHLSCRIARLMGGYGASFIKEEVVSADLGSNRINTARASYAYDFLLISSGSQVNFFGDSRMQPQAYALNSVADARRIREALDAEDFENFIVCGGGYTGIEAATNLWLFCRRRGTGGRVFIIERSAGVLGPLPAWMKEHVTRNLASMGIEVLAGSVVEEGTGSLVRVSGGRLCEKAMLVWVPGVRCADFIQNLGVDKNPQGRIRVDEYLRCRDNVFCAGDTAFFSGGGTPLRMAVQFSISQGEAAAGNMIRSMKNLPLKKFIPRDLGYVIPLANNNSCGRVFGLDLKGLLPTLLHFLMCLYRLPCASGRIGLAGSLVSGFTGRFRKR